MNRFGADIWAGVVGTVVCVVVGTPVLLSAGAAFLVPVWAWIACYLGFIVLQIVCTWLTYLIPRRVALLAYAGQVVLGASLVLLAPRAGWIPILLVFTAALGSSLVSRWWLIGVVSLNTAVVAASTWVFTDRIAEIAITGLIYAMLQIAAVLSVIALIRETRMRRDLAAAHTELRAAGALLAQSSRADERLRIARELHDLVGHQLTALTLELEVASHQSTPPANEHVGRARRIARDLLADVRVAVGELRRRAPDLRQSLERIVADLPEPDVHLTVDPSVSVDENSAAALVRCVQEIVTNTIRHASASELWIDIGAGDGDTVVLSARDDGVGPKTVDPGNGLRGIVERVEELGGRVRFWGDDGFHVTAMVPAS